jgi:phosphatidylserine/phosphatidylglycerophosphate/cardiolipin synthase-like enzyme
VDEGILATGDEGVGWFAGGAYDNDENTLILHDRELARAYYAEWQRLWATVPLERVCNAVKVWLPVVVSDWASQQSSGVPRTQELSD